MSAFQSLAPRPARPPVLKQFKKTTEDLHDSRPSPRTESLVGSAVQWAERIMRRIDGTFGNPTDGRKWPRA